MNESGLPKTTGVQPCVRMHVCSLRKVFWVLEHMVAEGCPRALSGIALKLKGLSRSLLSVTMRGSYM